MSLKQTIKSTVAPVLRAAWPAVEAAGGAEARAGNPGVTVRWERAWTSELDSALEYLPAVQGCTRDNYRMLLQPTDVPKRHALVQEAGAPIALISLRKRRSYWEPVAYQCLPGAVAPALNHAALCRAINALGLEVRISFGLGPEAQQFDAQSVYPYDVYSLPLQGDYESHWREHKQWQLRAVRRARTRCAHLRSVADGEGDLEWIVGAWGGMWTDDAEQEVVAAPDRLRFWGALQNSPSAEGHFAIHTVQLWDADRRVAGIVLLAIGDRVLFQCTARKRDLEELGVGTRVMDAAIQWAASKGFANFDLGGGDYKKRWAPLATPRYGAIFRPRVMAALRRLMPD